MKEKRGYLNVYHRRSLRNGRAFLIDAAHRATRLLDLPKNLRRHLHLERLEERHLLASDWQNPLLNVDVTDDGVLTPFDALFTVRDLTINGTRPLDEAFDPARNKYIDVTGDGKFTPQDVLAVVSFLISGRNSGKVTLGLATDSGISNTDLVTNFPEVTGTASSLGTNVIGKARIDYGNVVDVTVTDGAFSFDVSALQQVTDGKVVVRMLARDASGRVGLRRLQFTFDTSPPGVSLEQAIPRFTNQNLSVSGVVRDNLGAVLSGSVKLGDAPAVDLSLGPGGEFVFQSAFELDGSDDGLQPLEFQFLDVAGNVARPEFPFTLDTQPPPAPTIDLSIASDTGTIGDRSTSAARVNLQGQAEPGATVQIIGTGLQSLTTTRGEFQFPGIGLVIGNNVFEMRAVDRAGNASPASQGILERVDTSLDPDAVLRWNQRALDAVRQDASAPPVASRFLALVHLAMYDVVAGVEQTPGYFVNLSPPSAIALDAALSSAAARVLVYAYPGQSAQINAALADELAAISHGTAKDNGVAYGESVAEAIIEVRDRDGWNSYMEYTPDFSAGSWQPTSPAFEVALLPQWAQLEPFALVSPRQFQPAGPPSLESGEYANALNEVQLLGKATGSTRSADQTQIARFWADGPGTPTPAGHWNQIADQIALGQGNSLSTNARLFAALNVALADAGIAAWQAKFADSFWRPVTAIQQADDDHNVLTNADPLWQPLLISPPFPEYVSGHSTYSGAAAEILSNLLGDNISFTTSSPGLPGVQRSFNSFLEAAAEAGRSRVYGGIHFEFSNQDGLATGKQVADYVLQRFAVATDQQPPTIVVNSPRDNLVSRSAIALSGRVLDNLSGIDRLEMQLDNAARQPISFDDQGNFIQPVNVPLDGTADGPHVLTLTAIDISGNATAPESIRFTIDTIAPSIQVTKPLDGTSLERGAVLTGTADPTGSPLVALSYAFENGQPVPLSFDALSGSFSQVLRLGNLSAGDHTLTLTARDAAGNVSTLARPVIIDPLPPLVIDQVTPAPGSQDVGTTFRPQVFFSRPIDPSSLSSANFFATNAAGATVPATIVPAMDGTFAWLFFQNPLPGGSTITVHVVGNTIRAADDNVQLDADDNGVPGGTFTFQFSTVSLVPLAGTSLSGRVVDPGVDLKPMTFDDIRVGADGILHTSDDVFLNPIAGVKVFVLGLEDQFVLTDTNGSFHFDAIPGGRIKLAVDGRTATSPPTGFYFPEMVMDLEIEPGQANTVMGTMGEFAERLANIDRQEVYLPRLQTSLLRTVSDTAVSVIAADAVSAPNLSEQQREHLVLEVQPGSLIGANGQPISAGQVGISTVPPELVREMLPPGLIQHTFDITIQAPETAVFNTPLTITFPNVFNAAPGSQLDFLSFDHTTGRLVIEGTATVSADGLSATTDPGMGITKPGWHGITPPGGCGGSGGPPPSPIAPSDDEELVIHDPVVLPLIKDQFPVGSLFLTWESPASNESLPDLPPIPGCNVPNHHPGEQQPFTNVTIQIDGPLAEFMKTPNDPGFLPLVSQAFTLSAGTPEIKHFSPVPKLFAEILGPAGFRSLEINRLYGAKIIVTTIEQSADGTRTRTVDTYYLHRFLDATDDVHTDGLIEFEDTLTDGVGGVERDKLIERRSYSDGPELLVVGPSFFEDSSSGQSRVTFDPAIAGENSVAELNLAVPDVETIPGLQLRGDATPKLRINVNTIGLQDVLASIANRTADPTDINSILLTDIEREMFDTVAERQFIADLVLARTTALFAPLAGGIEVTDTPGPHTLTMLYETQSQNGLFGHSGPPNVQGDAIDNGARLVRTFADRNTVSQAERNFRLAESLQQGQSGGDYSSQIVSYPDTILEFPHGDELGLFLTVDELIVALAYNGAHEAGHTFGLLHSAQTTGRNFLQNTIQDLSLNGGSATDTFRLTFNGATTPAPGLPRNATAGAIEVELESLPTIGLGNVTVSSTGVDQFQVTFVGTLQAINDLPDLSGSGTGALKVIVNPVQDGSSSRIIGKEVVVGATRGSNDIMMGGNLGLIGNSQFQPGMTLEALKMAFKLGWTPADANSALAYYVGNLSSAGGGFNFDPGAGGEVIPDASDLPAVSGPILVVTQPSGQLVTTSLDFGPVKVDGTGGAVQTTTLTLQNIGTEPLALDRFELASGTEFSLDDVAPGVLAPGATRTVSLQFDPLVVGPASGRIVVVSNDRTAQQEILLSGFGQSQLPVAFIDVGENNLGAARLGETVEQSGVVTLTNHGLDPLTISGIQLGEGSEHFTLTGFPANLASTAISLEFGESFSFGATFTPSKLGLLRGRIHIETNDPRGVIEAGIAGTGTERVAQFDWGNDFVAVTTKTVVENTIRLRSDEGGNFNVFVPGNAPYQIVIFDPETALVSHGFGVTAPTGRGTDMTASLVFRGSTAPDSDFDGLPDDVELAIGTSAKKADTDGDGMDDFAAVQQNLNPLGTRPLATGVIANLALQGEANEIVLVGLTSDPARQTAYLATGSFGLAIVDASNFQRPIVLSELPLSGDALDIAVDPGLGIAAVVAAGPGGGLHLVDVSNPRAPRFLLTAQGLFTQVEVVDGVAYAGTKGKVLAIDLLTAETLQTLPLATEDAVVVGLAREGSFLYLSDNFGLQVIDVSSGIMQNRGGSASANGKLFAGGGVAYVPAGFRGFSTIDVDDPDNVASISGPDTTNNSAAAEALAVNGSGLLVGVGNVGFLGNFLQVYDVSDPANTAAFLTQFPLPSPPGSVALGAGIAFVADGSGGLVIVNYTSFDTLGQAPTASIATNLVDIDPGTPGIQALEGTTIPVRTTITDDVQVRNVELIVNGQVVSNDVSFPFDLTATALAANRETATIQLRATDTGGNTSLSNALSIQLVPDTFAPNIVSVNPNDGSVGSPGRRRITVRFNESMDAGKLVEGNFLFVEDGADGQFATNDDTTIPFSVQVRDDDRTVQLTFDALPAGRYQLSVNASAITDRAGNALDAQNVVSTFRLAIDQQDPPFEISGLTPAFGAGFNDLALATGDVDEDGDVDWVTANEDGTVSVLFNDGNGSAQRQRFDVAVGSTALAVALGDVNGDGSLDVVATHFANVNEAGSVGVLLNDGTGNFGAPTNLSVGKFPDAVALGDLDGDGDLDLVVANLFSNNVSVFRNDGTGLFGSKVDSGVSQPLFIALADVNGDGDLDLAIASDSTTNNITIKQNNGLGSFNAGGSSATVVASPAAVALGDIDGDSDLDLVSGNIAAGGVEGGVSVLRNDGSGVFGSRLDLSTDSDIHAVQLGDVDGDGDLDLIAGGTEHDHAAVFRNNGLGIFAERRDFRIGLIFSLALNDVDGDADLDLSASVNNTSVRVALNNGDGSFGQAVIHADTANFVSLADVNADGNQDIVTTNGNDAVSVTLSDGLGTFLPRIDITVGANPQSLAVVDIDGDLDLDLVTANIGGNSVTALRNNGTGTFGLRVDFSVGTSPSALLAADFDGDGDVDLATVNRGSDNITILLNDGAGTFGSRVDYAAAAQNESITVGDVDGDDDVDILVGTLAPVSHTMALLLNDGNAVFSAPSLFSPKLTGSVALRDIDKDDDLDLIAVTGFLLGSILVVRNDGTGEFARLLDAQSEFSRIAGTAIGPIALEDLDSDGDLDIAMASTNDVVIITHEEEGHFGSPTDDPSLFTPSLIKYSAGNGTRHVALRDVDGDGDVDIATADQTNRSVTILNNDGTGNFGLPKFGTPVQPNAVALSDVNGDGILDVITGNEGIASLFDGVSILLGDGAGGFGPAQVVRSTTGVVSIAVGDVDGDQDADIVTGTPQGTFLLLNDGLGNFSNAPSLIPGTTLRASSVALGDIDDDSNVDILIANQNKVQWVRNKGDGTYELLVAFSDASLSNPVSLTVGNFDADDELDIAVVSKGSSQVLVALNAGGGNFSVTRVDVAAAPSHVRVGDLDGDGDLDLATASSGNFHSISVLLNNGAGSFGNRRDFSAGLLPGMLAIADIDGDGDLDLVTSNSSFNPPTLSILTNDGSANFNRRLDYVFASRNASDLICGDVDGDGDPDIVATSSSDNSVSVLVVVRSV